MSTLPLDASAARPSMTELRVTEFDVDSQITRIQPGNPMLPRPGLPDFSDPKTFNFVVGLARELKAGDKDHAEGLAVIPADHDAFMQTSVGRYFAGTDARPDPEADPEGMKLLISLARHTLDVVGDSEGVTLVVAENEAGIKTGFATVERFGTLADVADDDEGNPLRRLKDVLGNPNDQYWQTLVAEGFIAAEDLQDLPAVAERLGGVDFANPIKIYTNPEHRKQGVGRKLMDQALGNSAYAETIREAEILVLAKRNMPNHTVVLQPATANDLAPQDKLTALALQAVPLGSYLQQYEDLKAAKSPHAVNFAVLEDPKTAVSGYWEIAKGMSDDTTGNVETLEGKVEAGEVTQREYDLLTSPVMANEDNTTLIVMAAFPSLSLLNEQSEAEPLDKVVMMPTGEELLGKLKDAGVLGVSPQTDRFYRRFVEQIADQEKVGAALQLAWELASYDTMRDLPSIVRAAVGMNFDRVVDVVSPDPEFAAQAKAFRQKVFEEIERQTEGK